MKNTKWTSFKVALLLIGLLAVVTLPGFYSYFYRAGAGHAFSNIMESKRLPWGDMTAAERVPFQKEAFTVGRKSALFMTLGEHLPLFLLLLITVGLLNRSIIGQRRVLLWIAFWCVWGAGMFFLAFGSGFWGSAIPFPKSLLPAFIIYLFAAMFYGIIIGVGNFSLKKIMNETKKDREQRILTAFLKASRSSFKLLATDDAQEIFADYNGENPDYIISDGKEHVGVELFDLMLIQSTGSKDPSIENLGHHHSKFPSIINNENDSKEYCTALKRYGLYRHDSLESILLERLKAKLGKLDLYCTRRIWLLGHADGFGQIGMVQEVIEDNIGASLRTAILKKINIPPRVERIILFETGTGTKEYIFDLKGEKQ